MPILLAAAAMIGLAVGSFLNVVVHRLPAGMSLAVPASHCPRCDSPIRARHNVPVVGWLVLRGRCADCRAPISARYPLVELITGLLFVAVTAELAHSGQIAALPALLYFVAIGVALALIDIDTHRLPNAIVLTAYPVIAALLIGGALLAGTPAAILRMAIGAAALFAAYFVIHVVQPRGMGWGDVKLAAVIGAVLGYLSYSTLLVGAFAAFLLGGITGIALIAAGRHGRKSAIPFGPFMVAGALAAVFGAAPIASFYTGLIAA